MIRSRLSFLTIALILLAACSGPAADPDAGTPMDKQRLRQAIFEAEDGRAPDEASLAVLVEAVRHPDADIRRMAVRALGRLERPALGAIIAPLLESVEPLVRAEAANALGQSVQAIRPNRLTEENRPAAAAFVAAVADRLSARLTIESDAMVRGVLAQTAGRLPYTDSSGVRRAEEILASAAKDAADPSDPAKLPFLQGLARGYESLFRLNAGSFRPNAGTLSLLESLAVAIAGAAEDPSIAEDSARVRRFSLMALAAAKRCGEATIRTASSDPDEQVRRLAFVVLGSIPPESISPPAAARLARLGLQDASGMVRYEALRFYGRIMAAEGLEPVLAALDDPSAHVGLLAVDLLGRKGPASEKALARLRKLAGSLGEAASTAHTAPVASTWHGPAHALVALASAAPDSARNYLPAFLSAEAWPARMYAARAAGLLEDIPALDRLSSDSVDNVRQAALSELFRLKGHEIDGSWIAALERPDYQLILTAARSLKQSPSPGKAVPALFAALSRLTDQKRDTSRDPRLAIIERIAELGSAEDAASLLPYVEDFDARVAESAAAAIERWTGKKPEIRPRPLPIVHARLEDVEKTGAGGVRVTMAGKGAFTLRLLLDEAPATAARFLSLVRAGYYDGLTFHRVVPDYLLQGGSPGANEYMGDGRYLRDELGLESHLRGAVGISTRGRDTGDAQICPDVCDNIKLDHDYTVFARVVDGMDVVDKVLECDIIEKIEIISAPTPPMGWNSWDSYGCTVNEERTLANADYLTARLAEFGWKYVVVDIRWYESKVYGFQLDRPTEVVMDAWGRFTPHTGKFPSASGGKGFRPLADRIHGSGLKFGLHLMRGIPRRAVELDTPILGTDFSARDVADTASTCSWNPDMYGVDTTKPGAQAYYDSVFKQFADWGVDFVKIDDLSSPYHAAEIEAIRAAIDRCGRPIVFSTSPGNTPLEQKNHIVRFANMWRILGDVWDEWDSVAQEFDVCRDWASTSRPGAWPDCDMIPLGAIRTFENDWTRFSRDEQISFMTLLLIARSPLMFGGDLTRMDDFTLSLLTNPEVLDVNQKASHSRELWRNDDFIAWMSDAPDGKSRYLAVFNTRGGERLESGLALFESLPVSAAGRPRIDIDVDLKGAERIFLSVDRDGEEASHDHAAWIDPVVVTDGGTVRLIDTAWTSATAGFRYSPHPRIDRNLEGGPLLGPDGAAVSGIGTHTPSLIEYILPPGSRRLKASGSIVSNTRQISESPSRGVFRFRIFAEDPRRQVGEPERTAVVDLRAIGLDGSYALRDLWSRTNLGKVKNRIEVSVPRHGARLFRLTPEK